LSQGRKRRARISADEAQGLAVQLLSYLAADRERLGQFLATTGLGPASLREAASSPIFLLVVLDYGMADETLLLSFSAERGIDPSQVALARVALDGDQAN
jgi:Protein of unknown function (DUF3572)